MNLKIGTLVLVVRSAFPHLVGRTGETTSLGFNFSGAFGYCVQVAPCYLSADGTWFAPRNCIVPLTPGDDPEHVDTPVDIEVSA